MLCLPNDHLTTTTRNCLLDCSKRRVTRLNDGISAASVGLDLLALSVQWCNTFRSRQCGTFQPVVLCFENLHRCELIRPNLIQSDLYAHSQRDLDIHDSPQQQADFGQQCGFKSVKRAVVAALAVVRSIVAKPGVAQLIPAQHPVNKESQRGPLGPLAAGQFGSPVS